MSSCRGGCGEQHGLVEGWCSYGPGCKVIEEDFLVYRVKDHSTLTFDRVLPVRHAIGEQVTPDDLLSQVEQASGAFTAAEYRIVPASRCVDLRVSVQVRMGW
jgi:hypothetical protein